jgi:hypothetical protein
MKRYLLLMLALVQCLLAGAKEWKVKTAFMQEIEFEMPDDYECTGEYPDRELRYVFNSGDGGMAFVYLLNIENLDVDKAKLAPDSLFVITTAEYEILDSKSLEEGPVSRIITIKDKDTQVVIRTYVTFCNSAIFIINCFAEADFAEFDQQVQNIDSRFMWWQLLGIILCVIVGSVPGFIFGAGLEDIRENPAKFWKMTILALLLILAAAFVVPMFFNITFWSVVIVGLIWTALIGLCLKFNIVIV